MKYFNKFIFKICKLLAKIVGKNNDEKFVNDLQQFFKFGIVGVSNTVIGYAINVLVLLAMRPLNVSWDYFVGNIVSFILSVLWSFYWNNKYVFKVSDEEVRSVWKSFCKRRN